MIENLEKKLGERVEKEMPLQIIEGKGEDMSSDDEEEGGNEEVEAKGK